MVFYFFIYLTLSVLGKLNLFIYLSILYLKVDKHQIHKTVSIKKIAMYKVIIHTC